MSAPVKSPPPSGGMKEFFAPMVAAIPDWFVYVVLIIMIGGYVGWGYYPRDGKPVDEHVTAVVIFVLLSILVFSMILATFYRLELSSGRENRRRLFAGPDDRHARGYQLPWDSYMWGAGSLHILTFVICIGVAIPALDNVPMKSIAGFWWTMFALWCACVLFLLIWDPSHGQKEKVTMSQCAHGGSGYMLNSASDGNTLVNSDVWKRGTVEQRRWMLVRERLTVAKHKYCKTCDLWYTGELRKHCWDCNKCVTGFDHHCPFLNQCIGSSNMHVFLVLLFVDMFLHMGSIAIGVDVLAQMWHGDVETEARDNWGRGLFIALNGHLVLFAGVLLIPILMLLSFQIWLQWQQFQTSAPHTTYMYTVDPKKQLRGIGAYLDVRAHELRTGVSRWKDNMNLDKGGTQLRNSGSDPSAQAFRAAGLGAGKAVEEVPPADNDANWFKSARRFPPADEEHSDDELPSDPQPLAAGRGEDVENARVVDEEAPLLNSDSSSTLPPLDVPSAQDQQTTLEATKKKSECRCTIS